MYKEDVQAINMHVPMTPRASAPIRQPSVWNKARALALPLTRVSWNVLLFTTIAAAFVAYWWTSNQLVSLGFSLETAQQAAAKAQLHNRDQELAAMSQESYRIVSERIAELGMVAVTDIEYVEALHTNVARR
jgi:hypothetical protein